MSDILKEVQEFLEDMHVVNAYETVRRSQELHEKVKAARAQGGQEVEPVGYLHKRPERIPCFFESYDEAMLSGCEVVPVYTHPSPPSKGGVPEGWRLVPDEPTEHMRDAAQARFESGMMVTYQQIYRAMVGSAPQPPVEQGEGL